MPTLSIIIVNYKSWVILQKNLEPLVSYTFQGFNLEIIVVDNCSNDNKIDAFRKRFDSVNIIENSGNWGFAHGCNLGAQHASGEILLFLNPDTLAPKQSIEKMFWKYKSDEKNGILTCKQSEKPSSYQNILPSIFTLFGPQRSLYKWLNSEKFEALNCNSCQGEMISSDWISGSVVMISREWFEKVGGWNTDYWMYSEDVELSKKVKDAGGLLKLMCDINIVHEHGGASRINVKTSALTKTEVIISEHVYIQNNFSKNQKLPSHILLIINTLVFKTVLALVGLLLFFLPKGRVQVLILRNCITYYFSALMNRTWLSSRSFNFVQK